MALVMYLAKGMMRVGFNFFCLGNLWGKPNSNKVYQRVTQRCLTIALHPSSKLFYTTRQRIQWDKGNFATINTLYRLQKLQFYIL